jgi:hypothetical protein
MSEQESFLEFSRSRLICKNDGEKNWPILGKYPETYKFAAASRGSAI